MSSQLKLENLWRQFWRTLIVNINGLKEKLSARRRPYDEANNKKKKNYKNTHEKKLFDEFFEAFRA